MPFDFQASYDDLNPADDDHRFYAALADERGAVRVLDLGCGTGVLACLLSEAGHAVVGVDPDPGMLRVARDRRGAEQVDWRLGTAEVADDASADLAVMSGHVAQVFRTDEDWRDALSHLHRALVPGGTLAFESRNPQVRGWEAWTREQTLRTVETAEGRVEVWHETVDVSLPLVAYDTVTRNLDTGHEERTPDRIAFRDVEQLRSSLEETGYDVVALHGAWAGDPLTTSTPEIIVVARRV